MKPYLETERGVLYQGDCLEVMKTLPDKSVDMILCDLPYGTTACSWDTIIPFDLLWSEYKRLIKPRGAIVLTGSEPFSSHLRMSNIAMYKYDWKWIKTKKTGFVHSKNMPLRDYEDVCVFSDGAINHETCTNNRMTYNPQGLVRVNKTVNNALGKFGGTVGDRPSNKDSYIQEYENYPAMCLKIDSASDKLHPTQKPVELFEYLIKTYTNDGMLVMDNCMGSGTTAVACENLNRKWIGIEREPKYCEIIKKRIEEHNGELFK